MGFHRQEEEEETEKKEGNVLPLPYISMPEWKTPIPRLEVYSFIQYCREREEERVKKGTSFRINIKSNFVFY